MKVLCKFKGQVEDVQESTFIAKLHPILGNLQDDHIAEFYKKEVPMRDHHRIVVGARFYWRLCTKRGSTVHFCRGIEKS